MTAPFFALLAGALTVVNPCVLPVLPFVLLGALDRHRWGPVALSAGLVASFTILGLAAYGASASLELSSDALRRASAVLLLAFGLLMMSSRLKDRFAAAGSGLTTSLGGLLGRARPDGLRGQFIAGALLGGIWSPCSGPTLGAAITLAASGDGLAKAAAIMLMFGLGAALPLLALAYGSRQALQSRQAELGRLARTATPLMGMLLAAAAVAVFTGADKRVEAALLDATPAWLIDLTTRF